MNEMKNKYQEHISVLNKELVEIILENKNEENIILIDLTFGAGGHTFEIANKLKLNNTRFKIYAFDQDVDAVSNGEINIKKLGYTDDIEIIHSNFENLDMELNERGIRENTISGIIGDLGVSSHHFDSNERGFSFRSEAKLDMRMDRRNKVSAYEIINAYKEKDLADLFYEYGEERLSRKIAKEIVQTRNKNGPIETTKELENIIFHCYPKSKRHGRTHPATKCFQALRVVVNNELGVLSDVIPMAMKWLNVSGRIGLISFQSMEDRIIKHTFREITKSNNNFVLYNKKPIYPSEKEVKENPRSRSAKLRVMERII
jgi:16S rRNA (cytosine1402-N4)-methyltransferase